MASASAARLRCMRSTGATGVEQFLDWGRAGAQNGSGSRRVPGGATRRCGTSSRSAPASRCRRVGPACPGVACPASHHHGPGSSKSAGAGTGLELLLRKRHRPGALLRGLSTPHQRHHLRGFVVRQRGHDPQLGGVGSIAQRLHPRPETHRPARSAGAMPPSAAVRMA